jgi:hypothetical protein
LRDAATDYLATVVRLTNPYAVVVPRLAAAIHRCGSTEVVDLCSGGGGPWPTLLPALRAAGANVSVCLTDKFPNAEALGRFARETPGVRFEPSSVSAEAVPARLTGFRTMFAGLHHFRPADARAILAAAVRDRRGIAIVEATARRPLAIALMFLVPLIVWLVTPRIRPFRWSRLFWTYLVPVVPAAIWFDGVVSCLRTYSPAELRAMAAEAADGFEWEAGADYPKGSPVPVTYLIGVPRDP